MKDHKTYYQCSECEYESPQWLGRCPSCGAWNSFTSLKGLEIKGKRQKNSHHSHSIPMNQIEFQKINSDRYQVGIKEFDNVLGGGIVPGSLILLGGEPGIGKSTLILQVANQLAKNVGKTLYITAEESIRQIYLRAQRLSVSENELYLLSETDLDSIISEILNLKPKIAIIDSIQIIHDPSTDSTPGSVNQVKNCTTKLMEIAKKYHIAMIIIGHVTKGGMIAGPKILEHMVDTVLYLEGERFHAFRLLRGIKNRFGNTNELGIFQMEKDGLREVINPSSLLLSARSQAIPGTVKTITLEGSRPLGVEIEALVSSSSLNNPRRTTTGVDYNRVSLIIAVLENRLGLQFQYKDIYVNAVGGIRISEPANDLAVALAIISSAKNIPIEQDLIVFGEMGLTGELRSVGMFERRISEARKMGYQNCIVPSENIRHLSHSFKNMKIIGISRIDELLDLIKSDKGK